MRRGRATKSGMCSGGHWVPGLHLSHYLSRFNAFHPDTHKPMHRECGFIRLEPDTNKVAFVSAQNTGTPLAGLPCTHAPCVLQAGGVTSAPRFLCDRRRGPVGAFHGGQCRAFGRLGELESGGPAGGGLRAWLCGNRPASSPALCAHICAVAQLPMQVGLWGYLDQGAKAMSGSLLCPQGEFILK